jgi:hypothetical protein
VRALLLLLLSAPLLMAAGGPALLGGDALVVTAAGWQTQGERPFLRGLPAPGSYTQNAVGVAVRWRSFTSDGGALGSRLGVELRGGGAWTPNEAPTSIRGTGAMGQAGVSLAYRVYTFNSPVYGALFLEPGLDLELGGARWWSDGERMLATVTARGAFAVTENLGVEVRFVAVPAIFGGQPTATESDTVERRLGLEAWLGPVGLGFEDAKGATSPRPWTNQFQERRRTLQISTRF